MVADRRDLRILVGVNVHAAAMRLTRDFAAPDGHDLVETKLHHSG